MSEKRENGRYSVDTTRSLIQDDKKKAKGKGITFRPYTEGMRARLEKVEQWREEIKRSSNERLFERLRSMGKLTARERIDRLFDQGTFYEVSIFAESQIKVMDMDKYRTPADGVICGFGEVGGRKVCAYATDYMVMAGSTGEGHAIKIRNITRMAGEMRVPIIAFIDSAGGRLNEAQAVLRPHSEIYYLQSIYSGVIPQISIICGGCAAGQAYSPLLTDFVIMTRNAGSMWLGGPRATAAVTTSEDITDIGGADYHMKYSGQCHIAADSDEQAVEIIKRLLSYLPDSCEERPRQVKATDDPGRREEKLLDILPVDPRRSYDMHDIIELIVDNGDFLEIQEDYAKNSIVGFCRFDGRTTGLVAGNPSYIAGCMEPDSCDKYTRFITFCDCFNIPLVYLVDMPALLVGDEWERVGIIRHGTKLLYTTNTTTVPRIAIIIRKAYGGTLPIFAMKPFSADFVYVWPTGETCIMGPDPAIAIIYNREIASLSTSEERLAFAEKKKREYFNLYGDPLETGKNMRYDFFDDIIDPRSTREVIVRSLALAEGKTPMVTLPRRKHGNRPV
jgi:acetyl-CoA carboxylase carboxyltransferase component